MDLAAAFAQRVGHDDRNVVAGVADEVHGRLQRIDFARDGLDQPLRAVLRLVVVQVAQEHKPRRATVGRLRGTRREKGCRDNNGGDRQELGSSHRILLVERLPPDASGRASSRP